MSNGNNNSVGDVIGILIGLAIIVYFIGFVGGCACKILAC